VNDVLCKVARGVELDDKLVGVPDIAGQIEGLEALLLLLDLGNLRSQDLVAGFLAVEEFGAFGGIVYYLRDLEKNGGAAVSFNDTLPERAFGCND
jgi:hypothetical protein